MPLSSKFLTESTGEKKCENDQFLAKTWTKCNGLLFGSTPYIWRDHGACEEGGWLRYLR